MSMNKQTIQYIVLGVMLVGLLVAVYFTIKPTTPAPSNATKPATTSTTTVDALPASAPLDWARNRSVDNLVGEIVRDPFVGEKKKDDVVTVEPPVSEGTTGTSKTGIGKLPDGRTDYSSDDIKMKSEPHKLLWIDGETAKAVVEKSGVTVTIKNGMLTLEGPSMEVLEAYNLLLAADVEPPVPDFGLRGIIMTEARPMAFGMFNGQYYQVVKGQAIPGSGWSVTRITDSSMSVTDGKRNKQIIAGGSK